MINGKTHICKNYLICNVTILKKT